MSVRAAPAHTLPLVAGQNLMVARKLLFAAGWKPVVTRFKLDDGTPENNFGDSGLFYHAGIKEVEACSGTGSNYCLFNYARGKQCLRIGTTGEYRLGGGPVVQRWSYACPSDGRQNNEP